MSDIGPIEAATHAWVRTLGVLSARSQVAAAQAVSLARLADREDDGAKASAISRELRQVVAGLTPAAATAAPAPVYPPIHEDAVQRLQDELSRKRRERDAG